MVCLSLKFNVCDLRDSAPLIILASPPHARRNPARPPVRLAAAARACALISLITVDRAGQLCSHLTKVKAAIVQKRNQKTATKY